MSNAAQQAFQTRFDAFGIIWTGGVLLITIVSFLWGINDLRRGSARLHFWGFGERVSRVDEPFEFWIAVGSKFLAVPVGILMIWFASDMFWTAQ